jgi:hypothetical protein
VAQINGGGASLTPLQPDIFWRGVTRDLPELAALLP